MSTVTPIRIPVCNSDGLIVDRADRPRARRLALAPNATVVRKRVTGANRRKGQRGEIVRIVLGNLGDDVMLDGRRGNPAKYSFNTETETNPEKVWCLKRIPTSTADLFGAVVNDCIAA
jgi:hypothetical protein